MGCLLSHRSDWGGYLGPKHHPSYDSDNVL
jgi:hypothetical protein